ncbi:MAG: hypothetical protein LKI58_06480 [Actinomyces sp.]|nr:hypothetical protein [Actinomyces sp.]MCI1642527.1 hypothetical protein [Actinomyces sp.]MCI1663121.1 hypothetical protein [Actinomyces sp.]MCI1691274.1 hypothetical protein [Actinomyces sp.]MCI1787697.1 hypothetical protein [Actinomyces sp.]MCI1830396.1 hypothetical protein [Actinomyces sp.]
MPEPTTTTFAPSPIRARPDRTSIGSWTLSCPIPGMEEGRTGWPPSAIITA